ncbi:MAG: ester cyclase [Bacteroidales bacterium]
MATHAVLTIVDVAKAQLFGYNEKNWDKLRSTVTPGFVYNELATGRKAQGFDEALRLFKGWAAAMPDSKGTVNNEIVSGNTVVLELTWTGTHSGPLETPRGKIAPTGKQINIPACQIIEVVGDKVNSVRHYFDMASLLNQIGAVPK